ncbi:hypothetical protein K9F62_11215 [Desulfovibrio sp. JY]|nr:hypothetical protein K9F62_11215 [Desulfovibrio sp. JY]
MSVWHEQILLLDSYGGDIPVRDLIVDKNDEITKISDGCSLVKEVLGNHRSFFDKFYYDWAFEKESYEYTPEVYWQLRALLQVACYGEKIASNPNLDNLNNIVTRQLFVTRYDLGSPKCFSTKNIRFISLPNGFVEAVGYIFSAFMEWVVELNEGTSPAWDLVLSKPKRSYDSARAGERTYLIIAKAITDYVKDIDVYGVDAVWKVVEDVNFFSKVPVELKYKDFSQFEIDTQHVVVDFAISHELGHILQGTVTNNSNISSENYLAIEKNADEVGFAFYATSNCYRHKVFKNAMIDDATKVIFGPIAFFAFSTLRRALLHSILSKKLSVLKDRSIAERLDREQFSLNLELSRSSSMFPVIQRYLNWLISQDVAVSRDSLNCLENFLSNIREFNSFVIQTVNSIPDASISEVITVCNNIS